MSSPLNSIRFRLPVSCPFTLMGYWGHCACMPAGRALMKGSRSCRASWASTRSCISPGDSESANDRGMLRAMKRSLSAVRSRNVGTKRLSPRRTVSDACSPIRATSMSLYRKAPPVQSRLPTAYSGRPRSASNSRAFSCPKRAHTSMVSPGMCSASSERSIVRLSPCITQRVLVVVVSSGTESRRVMSRRASSSRAPLASTVCLSRSMPRLVTKSLPKCPFTWAASIKPLVSSLASATSNSLITT